MRLLLFLIPAMLLVAAGSLLAAAELHTITSEDGSTIRAKILRANQDHVWVERDDGQTFQVPLSRLNEATRKEIKKWRSGEGAFPPDAFRFHSSRYVNGPQITRYQSVKISMTDGTHRIDARGIRHITQETGYSVTVENRRAEMVEGLHADYRIFTEDAQQRMYVAAGGKAALAPLPKWGKVDFKTSAVTVSKTKDRYTRESWANPSIELAGVWVRIYQGDLLIVEFSMPESLREKEKWGEPPPSS